MPIYDYECRECEHRFEVIEPANRNAERICPDCHGMSRRIISAGKCFTGNNDASWVRSVREVVAKGSDADAHDIKFLRSAMTKNDLKQWMTAKGLRHLEHGEPYKTRGPGMDMVTEKILRLRQKRRRIELMQR